MILTSPLNLYPKEWEDDIKVEFREMDIGDVHLMEPGCDLKVALMSVLRV
jgi:hypothetical protein